MAASVPERCPQCHSPVAERLPHAVMYDCGFSRFNDGEPVTDDYPTECQRRRIKRLEKQLTAARAEAERWKQQYEALREAVAEAADAIGNSAGRAWKASDLSAGSFDEGRAHGLEEAEDTVRLVLEQHKPEVADD